ncbi:MAG: T9SS type A sorting domain-containing protein, partial [Bacteroidota bacterium]
MRTRSICLALAIALICPFASAQWMQSNRPPGSPISCFAVSGSNLFAGTYSGGVFLSTDEGKNWTAVNFGLPSSYVTCFSVSGPNLFAGTYGDGVFLSTNNGTSWTRVNNGLPINPHTLHYATVSAFALSGTNLFAAAYGGGIWRRPLSEMITTVGLPLVELPTQFSLDQNYPNPFNPSTKIQLTIVNPRLPYEAQRGGQGQLTIVKVFDLLGREVATLVNEVKQPGTYSVQFDGSHLASGVYFYRLQAGTFVDTKK